MSKRALISVSDKTGLTEFAQRLTAQGWTILSTGGTERALKEAGIAVTPVEDITQFPECFSGRVKTMHPAITGGVLMRQDNDQDQKEAKENNIEPIDMVVVNLYPFEETLKKEGVTREELIEQIDIGGPTLLRSAAKNHAHVTVICEGADYERVLEEIETNGETSLELRSELATKVFIRTAAYDSVISTALSDGSSDGVVLNNGLALRYGENPHQSGSFFTAYGETLPWKVLQEEKQMSYLNILDADGAWNLIEEFQEPAAACIKHANPSGVAVADTIEEAFQKSYDADPLSAFGVIVAMNKPCTLGVIEKIIKQKIFVEVLIAPEFTEEALEKLKKRPKVRVIQMESRSQLPIANCQLRSALGGYLCQDHDTKIITEADLTVATDTAPTPEQIQDLLFAWKVVKHSKSNAIVFAKDGSSVGIGCGQTSRVDSTIIAARRAGDRAKGAVMASDAFFPFPDSIEEAAKNGTAAIVQPGGSIRDEEVIAKANELGIPMVFTGVRAFRH